MARNSFSARNIKGNGEMYPSHSYSFHSRVVSDDSLGERSNVLMSHQGFQLSWRMFSTRRTNCYYTGIGNWKSKVFLSVNENIFMVID